MTAGIKVDRKVIVGGKADYVAVVSLDRPDVANALTFKMIHGLREAWDELARDGDCRALVLTATGKHFSAGADLTWMQASAGLNFGDNLTEAKDLAAMFDGLYRFPRPTIAVIRGAAYGGAVGLTACCDVVLAADDSKFCLSEVKLGMLPAVIFPFLARRMAAGALRRYSLTARVFSGGEAKAAGLVDVTMPADQLDIALRDELRQILQASPDGQTAAKRLHLWLTDHSKQPGELALESIARARTGPSGQHGLQSFFQKKAPLWCLTLGDDWTIHS